MYSKTIKTVVRELIVRHRHELVKYHNIQWLQDTCTPQIPQLPTRHGGN